MSINSRGFSLVELMVAMVAGLLLVAAVTTLFVTTIRANSIAMKVSRLNQEIEAVTDMMARDIQRAGYDASAATTAGLQSTSVHNFHFDATADLLDETATGSKLYRCIRVRNDNNDNGGLNNPDASPSANNETRVYSYSPTTLGVKLATGASAACDSGSFLSTEDTIEITQLTFNLFSSSKVDGARAIQLNISGRYKDNPELTLSLSRDIKLRNDGY
ncbi:prepilin-type N-terminal cleavage/methylation domain-containing protein [Aeromonas caviae]|uniref:PilW family protein n=1 Tax=Aeromonas caviae TaxID=648 RepID=UPI0029D55D05|nr:prepilin-type N-terminal cleavage/methylation domain-containing protein [Aeromonas caviae]MDX7822927.1 prepilin-type N-terminal cleavage/methylation domain-containing protein [Aeromonas caviae]